MSNHRSAPCLVIYALTGLLTGAASGQDAPSPATRPSEPPKSGGELLKPAEGPPGRGGGKGGAPGGKGRDPRQAIFRTNVPDHPFDVIVARPAATSVTISLLSYRDADAEVLYGVQPGQYAQRTPIIRLTKDVPSHVPLAGLTADTPYYYCIEIGTVGGKRERQEPGTFHTARGKDQAFRFTVQADSHLDGGTVPELYTQTLQNVLADKPDFHLELGDTFMNDKYPSYRDSLRQYIAQRYYIGLACRSVPFFFVLGNHDGEGGWRSRDGEGMRDWSNVTRRKYFANPYPDGFYTGNATPADPEHRLEDYYAWTWGDGLFIVLDPFAYTVDRGRSDADGWNWTLGRAQYDWLTQTLAASKAKYKFVFLHHLVGGSGKEARGGVEFADRFEWGGKSIDGKNEFAQKRPGWAMPIHDLLVKHKVSAVFHGHDHLYAHQTLDGIAYMETPQPSHPADNNVAEMSAEYGYVSGKMLSSPGHIRVSVKPEGAIVEYVRSSTGNKSENGVVADSFVISPAKE